MLGKLSFYCPFYMLSQFDFIYLFNFWVQLKDLKVFTIIRVIFQLAEEIPCISAVVVALLAEVIVKGHMSTFILTRGH